MSAGGSAPSANDPTAANYGTLELPFYLLSNDETGRPALLFGAEGGSYTAVRPGDTFSVGAPYNVQIPADQVWSFDGMPGIIGISGDEGSPAYQVVMGYYYEAISAPLSVTLGSPL